MSKRLDLTGQRFGRLLCVSIHGSTKRGVAWRCKCDCGNEVKVIATWLTSGNTKSCGCLQKELIANRSLKHGDNRRGRRERLYRTWHHMKDRCCQPSVKEYRYYGARGISVCAEWMEYEAFKVWALSSGYRDPLTIERKDVNGNYCPENCEWIPRKDQGNNKRNSVLLTCNGVTKTMQQWANDIGINRSSLKDRLEHGLSIEDALTMPKQSKRRWLCPGSKNNKAAA